MLSGGVLCSALNQSETAGLGTRTRWLWEKVEYLMFDWIGPGSNGLDRERMGDPMDWLDFSDWKSWYIGRWLNLVVNFSPNSNEFDGFKMILKRKMTRQMWWETTAFHQFWSRQWCKKSNKLMSMIIILCFLKPYWSFILKSRQWSGWERANWQLPSSGNNQRRTNLTFSWLLPPFSDLCDQNKPEEDLRRTNLTFVIFIWLFYDLCRHSYDQNKPEDLRRANLTLSSKETRAGLQPEED